ncbi:MAG: DNA alkylation repair protein [Fermentimonas sp.]|nr:DNA alkylation repair protein [Fermentimonas sp.]
MKEVIRKIRTDLRLSMNGAVSSSMRDKGIDYRMNFGVGIPRIYQISEKYKQDKELAETLWNDDVRELKILATLLYPINQFNKELAMSWIVEINDQELREQLCKNLLQNLIYANELVEESIKNSIDYIRSTGYWLFARLCITKADTLEKINSDELLHNAISDLDSQSMLLRQATLNALKYYGRISDENGISVLQKVSHLEGSKNHVEKEILSILKFEFGVDS